MKDKENKEQETSKDVKEANYDVKSEVTTGDMEEIPSLKEVIKIQAIEGEEPLSSNFTLRKILGGDILTTQTIRRQIGIFFLITGFLIVYVANRYSVQKDLIEIDKLQEELQDAKYKALSSSSQLTEKSRESHVLEMLNNNKDSVLKIANQPPYIINVPEE
ncbi:FtsL-like putative cell division protein [Segatella paludivivens]|uniref:FtsL-like putative cell division protein n=1 Tax=Segatella paludivivens TaxID=185294 RepID=UPI000375AE20|nr:FtsL-like putative cell division protein [Segatella paludivivens]